LQRLADDIFCETAWDGANVGAVLGAVLGDEGFVLIDSPMLPRDARAWKSQIESHSPAPILYLINTDYHFDHIMTDCQLNEANAQ
jgi:glyoxylase-like metal-dependent hydrolase (beta-lactamase superfamily II)